MDTAARLTLLVLALGLALQPWSVIAAVLLAASRNGTPRATAFLLGWMVALSVIAYATAVFAKPDQVTTSQSTALSVADLVVGVVLGLWLFVKVRRSRRTAAGTAPQETPRWMARIDTMPVAVAFVLGGFLPSYVFVVAAVGQMLQSGLSGGSLLLAATAFVLVASLGVAAPLMVLVVRHDQAPEIHAKWRTFLIANSSVIMQWIVAVLALLLVLKGLVGLLA